MLEILSVLAAGILIGVLVKNLSYIVKSAEYLSNISIYFLLFFLGISVGVNDRIFNNLTSIGLLSLIITVFAVLGSVITSYFLSKYLLKIDNEK